MTNATNIITLPESALVVLVGVAGSGKSTFANEKFRSTEILSSDRFRGMVSDDDGDQDATDDAFLLLHLVLEKRLKRGRLCVVDATNLRAHHRAKLINIAQLYRRAPIAFIFETPLEECLIRAKNRQGREVNPDVIHGQFEKLTQQSDAGLLLEGFRKVIRLRLADRIEIRRSRSAAAYPK
jgi:protein phosphatase